MFPIKLATHGHRWSPNLILTNLYLTLFSDCIFKDDMTAFSCGKLVDTGIYRFFQQIKIVLNSISERSSSPERSEQVCGPWGSDLVALYAGAVRTVPHTFQVVR